MYLGIKMKAPTSKATMAITSTAPAARSFTKPACGCFSGLTKSVNLSIEVLKSSAAKTLPINRQ